MIFYLKSPFSIWEFLTQKHMLSSWQHLLFTVDIFTQIHTNSPSGTSGCTHTVSVPATAFFIQAAMYTGYVLYTGCNCYYIHHTIFIVYSWTHTHIFSVPVVRIDCKPDMEGSAMCFICITAMLIISFRMSTIMALSTGAIMSASSHMQLCFPLQ